MNITATQQELATILAALRLWQQDIIDNDGDYPGDFWDIASDCNTFDPLNAAQIDALCENIA
jgi:hypothetical protein